MKNLIQLLPVAVVLVGPDGRIVGWNGAATALYGWAAHETLTMTVDELIDPADVAQWRDVRTAVLAEHRWQGNFRVRRRDGVLLVSSFAAVAIELPGDVDVPGEGAALAWIATDTVDQAWAEQERDVVLNAERLVRAELETTLGVVEALLESAPLGMATFDTDLACTRTNPMFDDLIGVASGLEGRFVDDLPSVPSEAVAHLRRVVTTGRAVLNRSLDIHGRVGGRQVSANYFPIFAESRLVGAGLTWTDVTAAQRAEEERQALERRADDAQHRLAVLSAASSVLTTSSEVPTLLDRLARTLAPGAADWCVIELVDAAGFIEHAAVAHRDPELARQVRDPLLGGRVSRDEDGPIARVLRSGQAVLLEREDLQDLLPTTAPAGAVPDPPPQGRDLQRDALWQRMGLRSSLVVPVKTRGEILGVLCLSNTGNRALTDQDLDLALEVAHRAALAVGRAITYRDEHLLAQQLQRALLPTHLPEPAHLSIEVHYSAAAHTATVGGDWYDVFELPAGRLGLCIGDVFGHDIDAAVGMSRVRTLVHAFTVEEANAAQDRWPDLGHALHRTEQLTAPDRASWGTCLLAAIDTTIGELRWANAGHLPPILVRDGDAAPLTNPTGTILGFVPPSSRAHATHRLRCGDRLLLFTDGLVERRNELIDIGLARLAHVAAVHATLPLASFCQRLLADMLETTAPADDVALLALDYHR
jgi:PAS domain S-box-containing protein